MSDKEISFSVIIPLYNKGLSIECTIQSVLSQTYKRYELIIVNDGSTDQSKEVVSQILDPRIRLIDKENGGVSSARNRGIKEAKNDWIAFLDGDDLWDSHHLQLMENLIRKYPKYSFFASSITHSPDKLGKFGKDYIIPNFFLLKRSSTFINTDAVVVNRRCFGKAGGFDERFCWGEDLDMWRRLARYYKIVKSESITALYRLDSENRACNKRSKFTQTFLGNLDLRDPLLRADEIKHLKRMIIRTSLYMLYKRNIKGGIQLLRKHFKNLFYSKT